jgi:ubiquinone/menaquinone biosynthesis C-methylase UbiE
MYERRFKGDVRRLRAPERVERLEINRVIDLCLEGKAITSVLDIGTGSGLFAEAFSKHGLNISGLDVNPEMVETAHQFVPKGDFREGISEALPFKDKSFDLVFLGLLLHESDDTFQTLKESRRVAIQRVCILEWPYREQPFGPPLVHRLKPDNLISLFERAGYQKWEVMQLTNTVFYRLEG